MADVNLTPYAGCGSWEQVYSGWSSGEGQYYWKTLPITIVPGVGHIGMTVTPQGIAAVRKTFLDMTAPAIL